MSEEILSEFQSVEEVTAERILSQLLNKKKTPFHTEIHNPLAMSTLEILANYLKDKDLMFARRILKTWINAFKTNMVAYQRKRAGEIVEAYKKAQEEQAKTLREVLLGVR